MSEIFETTRSSNFLKRYIRFTFKHFYSEFIVIGQENIPTNAPVIFAPNHNNALMDALAIHVAAPSNLTIVFLARSDIFNNKMAAKILRFCKIMPAFRMRDGVENLEKNNAVFKQCATILDNKKALGIMPEGGQGEQRKLRPLMKGVFRIAFLTQEKHGSSQYVKIIPVGIDYGDFEKLNNHIIITFGKPIEVSDYMKLYSDNPVLATNEIRQRLKTDLSNITLDIATDEYYDCIETATEVANYIFQDKFHLPKSTVSYFIARQNITKKLLDPELCKPYIIKELSALCEEYRTLLKKLKLKTEILECSPYSFSGLFFEGFYLFATVQIFIYGFIVNFLAFFTPVLLRKFVFKTEYRGFYSSVHYSLGLITFPLFYLFQTFLFGFLTGFAWWAILLFLFSQFVFGKFALLWYSQTKVYFAKLRCRLSKKSKDMEQVQELRLKIIHIVNSMSLR